MAKLEDDLDVGNADIQYSGLDRALFGTLFAMCKGDESSSDESWVDWGPLIFEFLQCIGLPIQEIYQWPMGPTMPFIMEVLDMMDFQFFTATPAMSYALITVLSTVVLSAIFVFIALLFVFKNGDSQVPLFLVRLLRLITNACVTWGYQPFITIIFMIVDCHWVDGVGYTDVHPEVLCWSGPQLAFNILALMTLVAFIPFTQFVILFLYDFDCKHDILLSAYSGRYEFIEMLFKCVITAQSQWVSTYTHFRCVTCIAGFGFLMFYIMWMQPYHSLHSNVWASSQYVPTVTSSVYAWISVFTEGSNDLVIAFFWTTFFFFCIFGTWVLGFYARQIYLSRVAITYDFKIPVKPGVNFKGKGKPFFVEVDNVYYSRVRGFVHEKTPVEPTVEAEPPAPSTASHSPEKTMKGLLARLKPAIAKEREKANLPDPPYVIPKLKHVSHIDQAIRFLWRPEVRKRKEYIEFADAVYKSGFSRFPRHPGLHIHYALFLTHYKKDWEGCMKHMKLAFKLGATIDNRWIIYFIDKVYEQENSGADLKSADVMSLFRYKNHLSQAEQNQREAKEKLNTVLLMLQHKDDDLGSMSSLLDELIDNEKEAVLHFKALLQTHPFSIPVLRGYANLLTDIFRNDSEAQILYDRANEIEAEMIRLDPKGYKAKGRKRGTKDNVGARNAKTSGEEEQGAKTDVWLYVLKYGSPLTVVIFLGLGIWAFLIGLNNVNDHRTHIELLENIATAASINNELAYLAKLYDVLYLKGVILDPLYFYTLEECIEKIASEAQTFHDLTINKIFNTESEFVTWQETSLQMFLTIHESGVFSKQYQHTKTLINAANGYATMLTQLAGLHGSLPTDAVQDIIVQTLMNGPTSLDQAFKAEISQLVRKLADQNTTTMILAIVIIVVGLVLVITIMSIVYLLLTRLNKQRNFALFYMLGIKPDVLTALQQRLINSEDLEREVEEAERRDTQKRWRKAMLAGTVLGRMKPSESTEGGKSGLLAQLMRKNIKSSSNLHASQNLASTKNMNTTGPQSPSHPQGSQPDLPPLSTTKLPGLSDTAASSKKALGDTHDSLAMTSTSKAEDRDEDSTNEEEDSEGDQFEDDDILEEKSKKKKRNKDDLLSNLPALNIPPVVDRRKRHQFQNAVSRGLIFAAEAIFFVLFAASLLLSIIIVVSTMEARPWPVRVGLSGLREAGIQLEHFLALQILYPSDGVPDSDFNLRTSPGWTGLEHMSSQQDDVLEVFAAYSTYVMNLHNLCRFGEMPEMGDSVVDPMEVYNMLSMESVHSLMFNPRTCFMKNTTICTEKPDRIPTTSMGNDISVYGVEALLQLLFNANNQISLFNRTISDPLMLSPTHHSFIFINTALTYDLSDGLAQITSAITDEALVSITVQLVLVIVVAVVDLITIIISFFYLTFNFQSQINHVSYKTDRIRALISVEETLGIRWSKAFNLGEQKLDTDHHVVLDGASALLDHLMKSEEKQFLHDYPLVRIYLDSHLKAESKWLEQAAPKQAEMLIERMKGVIEQYDMLCQKFEEGMDITLQMSTLFNHFIDVHIMEENRRVMERKKEST